MVLSALGRLIMIPLGFVLGAVAAVFVLVTLGLERLTQVLHVASDGQAIETVFDVILQAHLLLAGLTLVPAILLIVIGEVARIRSALFYILGGGVALAAVPLLARLGTTGGADAPAAIVWQVFATAGFAGGAVYWLIAGRRA